MVLLGEGLMMVLGWGGRGRGRGIPCLNFARDSPAHWNMARTFRQADQVKIFRLGSFNLWRAFICRAITIVFSIKIANAFCYRLRFNNLRRLFFF